MPACLLLLWEALVRLELVPLSQAAAPSAIAGRLASLVQSGILIRHAAWSFYRIILGVSLGGFAGALSGFWLARSKAADRLLSPTLHLLSGVPVVVWIPFWVMLFGTGELFKIGMAGVATYFLVHVQALGAVRSVERDYSELADIYEKSEYARVVHVLLPFATPALFTAIRTSLAFGWVVIFFVEYASAKQGSEGLGWFIADARSVGRVEDEFAGLLFLAVLAYLTDRAFGAFRRRLLAWSDSDENSE